MGLDPAGSLRVVVSALKTKLTGLSTAVATAVTESDNILQAVGKLQGQVTRNAAFLPRRMGTKWYLTDSWYGPTYPFYNGSVNFVSYDGIITYLNFGALESASFKSIGVNVVTAGSAQIYLGIFTSDADGQPATLLYASAAIDGSTTGEKIATISGGLNISQGQRLMVAVLVVGASVTLSGYYATYNSAIVKAPTNMSGYYGLRRVLGAQTGMSATVIGGADTPSALPEIRLQAA